MAGSGLKDYGWLASRVEVAEGGALGTLAEVERSNMWDFLNVLGVMKAHSKYDAIINE